MTTPPIISNPAEITVDWLNQVLDYAGLNASVTGFTARSIGTGQVGENVRFSLQGQGVPDSLVGKFPSPDPVSKQTGIAQNNYIREVNFYQQLASSVDIQTPKILFTDVVPATHDFVIVMEDLAPGVQGDQIDGCNISEATLAMEELARLQGPRWGDNSLFEHDWLGTRSGEYSEQLAMIYQALLPGFLERYKQELNREEINSIKKLADLIVSYSSHYQGPESLIHIDYRLDNMMFGGPYPLAVVDWQSVAIGCPMTDAAYFMGTSLPPALRKQHEESLLKTYFDGLQQYDVDLSWDDCWFYYRQYAMAGAIMAVIASMIVGQTERGDQMFMAMAKRSCAMASDLDSLSLLNVN